MLGAAGAAAVRRRPSITIGFSPIARARPMIALRCAANAASAACRPAERRLQTRLCPELPLELPRPAWRGALLRPQEITAYEYSPSSASSDGYVHLAVAPRAPDGPAAPRSARAPGEPLALAAARRAPHPCHVEAGGTHQREEHLGAGSRGPARTRSARSPGCPRAVAPASAWRSVQPPRLGGRREHSPHCHDPLRFARSRSRSRFIRRGANRSARWTARRAGSRPRTPCGGPGTGARSRGSAARSYRS